MSDLPSYLTSGLYVAAQTGLGEVAVNGGHTSLDQRAQLVDDPVRHGRKRGWRFTFWLGCSEASLVWVEPRREPTRDGLGQEGRLGESGSSGSFDHPLYRPLSKNEIERRRLNAGLNWKVANSRARVRSRRYFVFNRLRYMWVLTFADPPAERTAVMARVAEFARRLRNDLDTSVPYWYSPELHPGGHGWHVNLFVPLRLEHARVAELWGHGFVWVTDFERSPSGPRGEPPGLCRTPARAGVEPLSTAASTPRRTGSRERLDREIIATRLPRASLRCRNAVG